MKDPAAETSPEDGSGAVNTVGALWGVSKPVYGWGFHIPVRYEKGS